MLLGEAHSLVVERAVAEERLDLELEEQAGM
jgi:hypothetical protein